MSKLKTVIAFLLFLMAYYLVLLAASCVDMKYEDPSSYGNAMIKDGKPCEKK